jgi:hypothetical protein
MQIEGIDVNLALIAYKAQIARKTPPSAVKKSAEAPDAESRSGNHDGTDMKTIGLRMIVKNEAQVILRCLRNVVSARNTCTGRSTMR